MKTSKFSPGEPVYQVFNSGRIAPATVLTVNFGTTMSVETYKITYKSFYYKLDISNPGLFVLEENLRRRDQPGDVSMKKLIEGLKCKKTVDVK